MPIKTSITTKLLTALPLIAALAISAPVFAQENTETTTEATTETTAETTTDTDLALGQEVGSEDLGTTYIKEEIGDWNLQCIRTEQDEDPCQLYQLLKDENGNDVAEISMFRLPEGGEAVAGATIIVPLETLLTAQLTIAVDGSKGKRYPFAFCSSFGCYSRIGLTADDVNAFKRGATGSLTIVPNLAPDEKVTLKLSLKGFTAGFGKTTRFAQ